MSGGGFAIIIWIAVFFGIFYFLAVRPQRRQRQAQQEMVASLAKGDEIVTVGGLFGVVRRIGDDWIELEITKGTRVRFLKRAVSQIVSEEEEEDEYEEYADEIEVAEEVDAVDETADRSFDDEPAADENAGEPTADEPGPEEWAAEGDAETGAEKPA
jgi:preprotein translocase subunit YajC